MDVGKRRIAIATCTGYEDLKIDDRLLRHEDFLGQEALESTLARHDAMVQPFLPSLEAQGELSLIYIEGRRPQAPRPRRLPRPRPLGRHRGPS